MAEKKLSTVWPVKRTNALWTMFKLQLHNDRKCSQNSCAQCNSKQSVNKSYTRRRVHCIHDAFFIHTIHQPLFLCLSPVHTKAHLLAFALLLGQSFIDTPHLTNFQMQYQHCECFCMFPVRWTNGWKTIWLYTNAVTERTIGHWSSVCGEQTFKNSDSCFGWH